jgi:hypothetical protein
MLTDRILELVGALLNRHATRLESVLEKYCESPIERLMLLSLLDLMGGDGIPVAFEFAATRGIPAQRVVGFQIPGNTPTIVVPQLRVEVEVDDGLGPVKREHRLDIAVRFPPSVIIDVECDGHDFHERTPEQAQRDKARDRAVQAIGVHVARFTGAEITRDLYQAAWSVLRLAVGVGMPPARLDAFGLAPTLADPGTQVGKYVPGTGSLGGPGEGLK